MKIEDLKRLRESARRRIEPREGEHAVRVVLSMSTVGIAAGARDVLRAVVDELERQEIDDVDVSLSGSMGCDNDEVVMRVQTPAGEVTYGHLDPERARQIVQDHIRDGRKVERYIIARPIGTQADTGRGAGTPA